MLLLGTSCKSLKNMTRVFQMSDVHRFGQSLVKIAYIIEVKHSALILLASYIVWGISNLK